MSLVSVRTDLAALGNLGSPLVERSVNALCFLDAEVLVTETNVIHKGHEEEPRLAWATLEAEQNCLGQTTSGGGESPKVKDLP